MIDFPGWILSGPAAMNPKRKGKAMNRIVLETSDGEYVHSVDLADEPPDLIIWNGRYFVSDEFEPIADNGLTFTEVVPLELPYEMPQARPAEDNGGD